MNREQAEASGAARKAFEERALAELARADAVWSGADAVRWRGNVVPSVMVVKGMPGPAETSGGPAVSGLDGTAISQALQRLGHDPGQAFFTLSWPISEMPADKRAERLRLQVEAVDAPLVIALDARAADDLAVAFDLKGLPVGKVVRAVGRRLVACDGLEEALGDERAKRRVWRQLSAAAPEPPVF